MQTFLKFAYFMCMDICFASSIATLFYTLYNIQSVAVFLLFELRPPPVHFYRLLALDAGVLVLVISRINHGARVRAQRILMN